MLTCFTSWQRSCHFNSICIFQMEPHPPTFHPHDLMMDIQNSSVNQSQAEKKQKTKKRKEKSDDSENVEV